MVRVVQGVLIYPGRLRMYGLQANEIDNLVFGLHRTEHLLQRIMARSSESLTVTRPPALRIGVICRNFALLLVSMLRQQEIPARLRVGFGGYFPAGKLFYEHRITQYWDSAQQRWILADPMMDEVQRKGMGIQFNTLDIGPNDPFVLASDVWLRCRAGELDPNRFGDSDTDIGMAPIRYALLHDFAALNGFEVLGNDDWGELIRKPETAITPDDLTLLDQIATLTMHVDTQLDTLRALFSETTYGQTMQEQVALLA